MGNQARDDKSVTRRLLSCKIDTLVSTFNIRSLNSNEEDWRANRAGRGERNTLVCLQEHRKFHDSGDVQYTDVGKGWILATSSCWRNSVNSYVGELGMLLSASAYNYLEDNVVVVNSRILVADLSGNPATTIICCYSSTNCSNDNDALDFYNTLSEVIRKLLEYKIIYTVFLACKYSRFSLLLATKDVSPGEKCPWRNVLSREELGGTAVLTGLSFSG